MFQIFFSYDDTHRFSVDAENYLYFLWTLFSLFLVLTCVESFLLDWIVKTSIWCLWTAHAMWCLLIAYIMKIYEKINGENTYEETTYDDGLDVDEKNDYSDGRRRQRMLRNMDEISMNYDKVQTLPESTESFAPIQRQGDQVDSRRRNYNSGDIKITHNTVAVSSEINNLQNFMDNQKLYDSPIAQVKTVSLEKRAGNISKFALPRLVNSTLGAAVLLNSSISNIDSSIKLGTLLKTGNCTLTSLVPNLPQTSNSIVSSASNLDIVLASSSHDVSRNFDNKTISNLPQTLRSDQKSLEEGLRMSSIPHSNDNHINELLDKNPAKKVFKDFSKNIKEVIKESSIIDPSSNIEFDSSSNNVPKRRSLWSGISVPSIWGGGADSVESTLTTREEFERDNHETLNPTAFLRILLKNKNCFFIHKNKLNDNKGFFFFFLTGFCLQNILLYGILVYFVLKLHAHVHKFNLNPDIHEFGKLFTVIIIDYFWKISKFFEKSFFKNWYFFKEKIGSRFF